MIKKMILLALIAAILLAGCKDPVKKVKDDLQEAKESLDAAGDFVEELRNGRECLDTALSDGEASAACPRAGD